MKIYKKRTITYMYDTVMMILGTVLTYILTEFFVPHYSIYITAAAFLILFYINFVSDRTHFELDDNELRYYKGRKQISAYELSKDTEIGYHIDKKELVLNDISFYINHDNINVSSIGKAEFDRMYDDIIDVVGQQIKKGYN